MAKIKKDKYPITMEYLVARRSGRKRMGQFCCRFVPEVYSAIVAYGKMTKRTRAEVVRIAVVDLLREEGLL